MLSFFKETARSYISLYSLVFLIYALSFTLLSSLFNYRKLLKKYEDDLKALFLYFAYFSLFLLIIPVIAILLFSAQPLEALAKLGFELGDYRLGLKIILISIPLCVFFAFIGSNDPKLKDYYPYSKKACKSPATFVLYEASYLFLYYVAWEFAFRGFFLFSIAGMAAGSRPGILTAILVQTIISTVFHLGHPDTEIFSSFIGGIIFGTIAYATKSFLYTIFIHSLIGILNDTFIYLRHYRKAAAKP
jgi:MFS family permease